MTERRIFGPPGTGKTELLASVIIPQAVEKFGVDSVMVCSLTKTGARTIASRSRDINQNNVGTIHKICYRGLGTPKLTVEKISDWNAEYPSFALAGGIGAGTSSNLDECASDIPSASVSDGISDGEKLMSSLNILRSKLVPYSAWPENIKSFSKLWSDFKETTGTVDFTDLIEIANRDLMRAPGNPVVLVVDEAQDTNPLQLQLLRGWAVMMDEHILVGDDDQTIFEFAGCTAEAFLNPPLADEFKRVLSQSYRVPAQVHKLAMNIINRVSFREPKEYKPRKDKDGNYVQGVVRKITGDYKKLDYVIHDLESKVDSGQSVMFLTSCAYMVDPIKAKLIEYGIPFENEFRRRRGDWNPLYEKGNGVSSKKIIQSFMGAGEDFEVNEHGETERIWTVEQFITWTKFLSVSDSGLIRKVGKKVITALEQAVSDEVEGLHSARNVIAQVIGKDGIKPAMRRDIVWLCDNIQKARISGMQYPLRVIEKHGIEALARKPKVTIGTIHSVKGGEADCVYVCPDISMQAAKGFNNSVSERDSIYRLFYVAVTRAKNEVVVLDPATKHFFTM